MLRTKCSRNKSLLLALLCSVIAVRHSPAQDNTWQPTNDPRLQYRWSINDSIKDNWRCVIAFRWLGPEPENRAYSVKGRITYERDRYGGGGQLSRSIFLLFTKTQKESNADQTGCGRLLTVSINSVE